MQLHPLFTLTHHGAVTGVTGSCHELTLHGPGGARSGILVDCGVFQGDEAAGRGGVDALAIDFPIAHLRALVVTHVHIDHGDGDRDHEDRATRRLKAIPARAWESKCQDRTGHYNACGRHTARRHTR